MGIKEILSRIKKLEERTTAEDRVILICIEDGKECRKNMGVHEASMLALKQDMAKMFGLAEEETVRIIGVESGDDDGFIMALLNNNDGIDWEEMRECIEE